MYDYLHVLLLTCTITDMFYYIFWSSAKASMELVHNRCWFADKQMIKLQEAPENIAEGKLTRDQTGPRDDIDNAVDGIGTTCTQVYSMGTTGNGVWWRVDFGDLYRVAKIMLRMKSKGTDHSPNKIHPLIPAS